jgi:hypothetical protein
MTADMDRFRAAVAHQLTGAPAVELSDRLPDLYTAKPDDSISVGDTLAWAAAHAATARDRATEARDAARDAVRGAAVAAEGVKALTAKVDALTLSGGTVDLDALAEKVADLLASRLVA